MRKKKKTKNSLSGFGIGCLVVLAVAMIVRFYLKFPDDPFYMRILEGAWRCAIAFIGSGVVFLAMFFAVYGASKIQDIVFRSDLDDDPPDYMDLFSKLTPVIWIVCFCVSYVLVFLEL